MFFTPFTTQIERWKPKYSKEMPSSSCSWNNNFNKAAHKIRAAINYFSSQVLDQGEHDIKYKDIHILHHSATHALDVLVEFELHETFRQSHIIYWKIKVLNNYEFSFYFRNILPFKLYKAHIFYCYSILAISFHYTVNSSSFCYNSVHVSRSSLFKHMEDVCIWWQKKNI